MLIVRERTGDLLTVHDSRLFPADAHRVPMLTATRRACLKCGRVQGIVEDQVRCPDHSGCAACSNHPKKTIAGRQGSGFPQIRASCPRRNALRRLPEDVKHELADGRLHARRLTLAGPATLSVSTGCRPSQRRTSAASGGQSRSSTRLGRPCCSASRSVSSVPPRGRPRQKISVRRSRSRFARCGRRTRTIRLRSPIAPGIGPSSASRPRGHQPPCGMPSSMAASNAPRLSRLSPGNDSHVDPSTLLGWQLYCHPDERR